MTPSLNESARPDYAFWFSTLNIKVSLGLILRRVNWRKYIRELFGLFLERPSLRWS